MAIDMHELTREILRSDAEREAFQAELPAVTHAHLQQFAIARERMGGEQRARRARERAQLARETATRLRELSAGRHDAERRGRTSLLRADGARRLEAAAQAQERARLAARRRAEVVAMLLQMGADRARERREWDDMEATLRRRRKGRGSVARALRAGGPRPAAPAQAPAGDTPEAPPLAERVFEHLAGHAGGARLVDLSERFHVARIRMAGVLRKLIDDGRVEKRELHYLARSA